MVRPALRQLPPRLAPIALVIWAGTSFAEPPPEPAEVRTVAHQLVQGVEGRVTHLLPSVLAGTVDRLHLKGRGIEYRHPLPWKGHGLELRLRGGRVKGKAGRPDGRTGPFNAKGPRGYGVQVEVRF